MLISPMLSKFLFGHSFLSLGIERELQKSVHLHLRCGRHFRADEVSIIVVLEGIFAWPLNQSFRSTYVIRLASIAMRSYTARNDSQQCGAPQNRHICSCISRSTTANPRSPRRGPSGEPRLSGLQERTLLSTSYVALLPLNWSTM